MEGPLGLDEIEDPREVTYVLTSVREVFPFNVFGYWRAVRPFLDEHAEEIRKLLADNLEDEPVGEFEKYFVKEW